MVHYRTAAVDGHQVFYREAGDPEHPTLVLLHGFPSSSHVFRNLIPLLANRFHIVAPAPARTSASFPGSRSRQASSPSPAARSRAAKRLGAEPAQVALAWLLKKSPVMLPIPGTSSVQHLEENAAAALLELDDSLMEELERGPAAH